MASSRSTSAGRPGKRDTAQGNWTQIRGVASVDDPVDAMSPASA
jgi:hypothetical protein